MVNGETLKNALKGLARDAAELSGRLPDDEGLGNLELAEALVGVSTLREKLARLGERLHGRKGKGGRR